MHETHQGTDFGTTVRMLLEEYFDIVEDSAPAPDLPDKKDNTALHLAAIKNGHSVGRTN